MEQKLAFDLHAEHKTWLNKIAFYKDDLKVISKRLEEIASKNNSKEVLALVEHFQNQFKIQLEIIDTLNHEINEHEDYIKNKLTKNSVAADKREMNDHPKHRESVEGFEKHFNELRKEFINFAAKWM